MLEMMSHIKPYLTQSPQEEDAGLTVKEQDPNLKEPRKYVVLLYNDDFTTMEFVVDILKRFFNKSQEEAAQIMLTVHHTGRGLCGVFSYEIAEMKVMQVQEYARQNGFPLKCTMEAL